MLIHRYGLGQAFVKMSKLKYAEHHFRRAVEINPSNPVLLCCIGQVSPTSLFDRGVIVACGVHVILSIITLGLMHASVTRIAS